MQITAQLAPWERRRPLVLISLCTLFAIWFAWDGWYGWPNHDDAAVKQMLVSHRVTGADKAVARRWPGWRHANEGERLKMDHLVHVNNISGWHSVTDIQNQRWIVLALILVAVVGLMWFLRVKSRHIVADEKGLHLPGGHYVAFTEVTRIDNRRWPDAGLVTIESVDSKGGRHHAVLDGVVYENLPPLLNEVITRAIAAEVINPGVTPSSTQAADTAET